MRTFWAAILLLSVFASCDNEIDLTAEYKDITVVYGLLDPKEDTQWIRVNKAFLGDGNALQFAQIADSLYYPNVNVSLLVFSSNEPNATRIDSIALERVEDPFQRDSGIFAFDKNILYRCTKPLNGTYNYRLKITFPGSDKVVESRTPLCRNLLFSNPPLQTTLINFEANAGNNPNPVYTFAWPKPTNVVGYQFTLTFRYYEFPFSNPANKTLKTFTFRSVLFDPLELNPTLTTITYPMSKREFYSAIVANISENQELAREFVDMDVIVYTAGQELYRYITINQPSGSIVQKITDYTNITNGLGLFSSRSSGGFTNMRLAQNTLDSLRDGQYTRQLNFQ